MLEEFRKPISQVHDHCSLMGLLDDEKTILTKDGKYSQVIEIWGKDYNGLKDSHVKNLFLTRKEYLEEFDQNFEITIHSIRFLKDLFYEKNPPIENKISNQIIEIWKKNFKNSFKTRHFLVITTQIEGFNIKKKDTSLLEHKVSEAIQQLREYLPKQIKGNELMSFWATLINGKPTLQSSKKSRIFDDSLNENSLFFPKNENYMIYETSKGKRYSTFINIKDFTGSETSEDILENLFKSNFEFVLTQSLEVLDKENSIREVNNKINFTLGFTKHSELLRTSLKECAERISASEILLCNHRFCIQLFSDSTTNLNKDFLNLKKNLSGTHSIRMLRESQLTEPLYWSLFPGRSKSNVRVKKITTENASHFVKFTTSAEGLDHCSWGNMPITQFKTLSNSEFNFCFHLNSQKTALGNTLVVGGSGDGKTTLMSFLITNCMKFKNIKIICFDRMYGMGVPILMQQGKYFDFKDKADLNPFQFEGNQINLEFLVNFFCLLSEKDDFKTKDKFYRGLKGIYQHPAKDRNLHQFIQLLGKNNTFNQTLKNWDKDGIYKSYFNGKKDSFSFDENLIGFDMTSVMDKENNQIFEALSMYLFHKIQQEVAGNPFLLFIDEMKPYLQHDVFSDYFVSSLQEFRKLNGVVALATQNAEDIYNHEKGRKTLSNIATFILFKDPSAKKEPYIDGFGLNEEEYKWIVSGGAKREVLIKKKGAESTILNVDLSALKEYLKIFDSSRESWAILQKYKKEDPTNYEEKFLKYSKGEL